MSFYEFLLCIMVLKNTLKSIFFLSFWVKNTQKNWVLNKKLIG